MVMVMGMAKVKVQPMVMVLGIYIRFPGNLVKIRQAGASESIIFWKVKVKVIFKVKVKV